MLYLINYINTIVNLILIVFNPFRSRYVYNKNFSPDNFCNLKLFLLIKLIDFFRLILAEIYISMSRYIFACWYYYYYYNKKYSRISVIRSYDNRIPYFIFVIPTKYLNISNTN